MYAMDGVPLDFNLKERLKYIYTRRQFRGYYQGFTAFLLIDGLNYLSEKYLFN
jgi:hypothetical protein